MNDSQTLDLEKIWKKNLFVIWLSQFLAMVGFGCCMPFIPLLLRENLHISDDSVRGMYVSIYYLAGMLSLCAANAIWGMLADRFGRKIMLLRASFGAAFIYPLLAFAPNFWVLVLIRFVCSFFSGTVNPAQTLAVSTAPAEKHGFVLGTISTAVWSGNMVGYMGGGLMVEYFGYTTAFLTCGAVYLVSGLLVLFFVTENFRRDVAKKKIAKEKGSFRELATPGVLWLLGLFLLMGIARRIEQPFIAMQVELVHGHGKAAFYTGISSAAAAAGGMVSGMLIGYLCDKFKPGRLMMPVLFVSGAATLAQAFSVNIEMLILSRFLTYLAAGGIQPILQILLTKITSPARQGTFFGWSASVNTAGGIVCSLMSGSIAYFWGVRGIFVTAAVMLFLMIPLMIPASFCCRKEEAEETARREAEKKEDAGKEEPVRAS
ncbi:MAG: MFS transporter [Lentisphaeria bacterium]|nr:MFS transporter [Lentisphaeria bacterium]